MLKETAKGAAVEGGILFADAVSEVSGDIAIGAMVVNPIVATTAGKVSDASGLVAVGLRSYKAIKSGNETDIVDATKTGVAFGVSYGIGKMGRFVAQKAEKLGAVISDDGKGLFDFIASSLGKGSSAIILQGPPETREWENKK